MNTCKRFLVIVPALFAAAFFFTVKANAEEFAEEAEIERQLGETDLTAWEVYLEDLKTITGEDFASLDEILAGLASNGSGGSAEDLLSAVASLAKNELKKSAGPIAMLTATAVVTSLAGVISDKGAKRFTASILVLTAAVSVLGVLTSLVVTARKAVSDAAELSERTTPVVSALMISIGSNASLGIFRPLFFFLSETVALMMEKIVFPLITAQGIVSAADALTDGAGLSGILKLLKTSIKWILGAVSTIYFGVTAVQGLTAAARDGVAIRTAKFALDKMVPVVGSMVGGTVDSVLGCALLLRNGVGTAAILLLFAKLMRPLIVLFAGMFIFRAAEALSSPLADERAVRLLSNAADTVGNLFACAAAAGSMLALTLIVIMTSGGIAAGLW